MHSCFPIVPTRVPPLFRSIAPSIIAIPDQTYVSFLSHHQKNRSGKDLRSRMKTRPEYSLLPRTVPVRTRNPRNGIPANRASHSRIQGPLFPLPKVSTCSLLVVLRRPFSRSTRQGKKQSAEAPLRLVTVSALQFLKLGLPRRFGHT